jgi:hypothetical protein
MARDEAESDRLGARLLEESANVATLAILGAPCLAKDRY